MNRKVYFLCNIKKENWEKLFFYFINKGDNFKVYLPLKEGETKGSIPNNFSKLSKVSMKSWKGMKNSIEISGELNEDSKVLIIKYEKPSFLGGSGELWSLEIYLGGEKLVYIGDFNDRLVYLDQNDFKFIREQNIDVKDWIEVDMKSEEDYERERINIVSFTDEELKIIENSLGREANQLND